MRNWTLAVVLLCGGSSAVDAQQPGRLTFPVHTIPVKGQPSHLLVHQDRLFVSCFHGGNLGVFDTATRKELQQLFFDASESPAIPEQGVPRSVYRCPPGETVAANGKLFVGQTFSDHIIVFDLKTMWVVKRLVLGGNGSLAASADGKTVYFASAEKNEFHIIDTETYKVRTVPYPTAGTGIGCVALGPDGKRLYLGIQRGGKQPDGKQFFGSNAFLAVYDLTKGVYAGTTDLAQTEPGNTDSEIAIPFSLAFSPTGRFLYVGMFQSLAGIQVVDTTTLKLVGNIPFKAGPKNTHFKWVDPLAVKVYRRWLLAVNRNNNELVFVDRETAKLVALDLRW